MLKVTKSLLLLLLAVFVLTNCKDKADDPKPDDDNELITTVKLTFAKAGTTTPSTFLYQNPTGGSTPTKFDQIMLDKNSTYTLSIELLDESKSPVVDITEEVEEKSDEHLFVFTPTPGTGLLAVTITDKDANNLPIGLESTVVTGTTATGKLRIQLRHQPPLNGVRAKNGTATPGSDDVNLEFSVMLH